MGTEDGIVWFLRADEERVEGVVVLNLEGRVSHATLPQLEELLAPRPEVTDVILDLAGVDYVNGAGLRALETAAGRLGDAGHTLVLCQLRPVIRTAVALAGPVPHLHVEENRDTALRWLQSSGRGV